MVVFESTVYPGATEEICAPALERSSGLSGGIDFKLGYSPERINPGDAEHPLEKIVKIVSAQDEATLERVAAVYGSIIEAGVTSHSVNQGSRSSKGDREHSARCKHRADERNFKDLPSRRHSHNRCLTSRAHEMELSPLFSGPCWGSLHRS